MLRLKIVTILNYVMECLVEMVLELVCAHAHNYNKSKLFLLKKDLPTLYINIKKSLTNNKRKNKTWLVGQLNSYNLKLA